MSEEKEEKTTSTTTTTTTGRELTEIQKWLVENNLPVFLDKLLGTQNINALNDLYTLEEEKIDALISFLPESPIVTQLKKALYRTSDRVIMSEMESIYGKWRGITEQNQQLKKFKDILMEQVRERNVVIKKLHEQNTKLTKDVLQATLALTQIQLQLSKYGIVLEQDSPELSSMMSSTTGTSIGIENGSLAQYNPNANQNDDDQENESENDPQVENVHSNDITNTNNNNNTNNSENSHTEMKACDLCEMSYSKTICISNTCHHCLCVNCCKNSITSDISVNQTPECPVCRNSGNHIDITGTSQAWQSVIDPDIWALYQQSLDTSV